MEMRKDAEMHPINEKVSTGVEQRFDHYLWGKAPAWALASDQRFSYYAYVPPSLRGCDTAVPLVIVVHGTLRQPQVYRDEFVQFAEDQQCAVLAPLFPAGIIDPEDIDNYKRLEFRGIRFDQVLIEMVDEFATRYQLSIGDWYLHGFSGGGQFAHRFLYLHPERLAAVSVGAPGAVTLVDSTRDWWVGTADVLERFGTEVEPEKLRKVPVLLVIGEDDYGSEETVVPPDSRHWMPDANHAGADRQERLKSLRRNLAQQGMEVRLVRVSGVRHRGRAVMPVVREFFDEVLRRRSSQSRSAESVDVFEEKQS